MQIIAQLFCYIPNTFNLSYMKCWWCTWSSISS